jgi:hypothetical protein
LLGWKPKYSYFEAMKNIKIIYLKEYEGKSISHRRGGYLGAVLVNRLLEEDFPVRIVDSLFTAKKLLKNMKRIAGWM